MSKTSLLLLLVLTGCIDAFNVSTTGGEPVLVVDGAITDQPGPYEVRLSWSAPPSGSKDTLVVTGASVWISDNQGLTVKLEETQPGLYATAPTAITGETGNTYRLRIVLDDNTEYESLEEQLMPAGELKKLYAEVRENYLNDLDPTQPSHQLHVFVDAAADPSYPEGLTRWRWLGIYEVRTYPELRTKWDNGVLVPDPYPCSGYIVDDGALARVDTCSCCTCWVYEYGRDAIVSPNQFVSDNQFNKVNVAKRVVDSEGFFYKYYMSIEQLSVSENVYEFWKRVQAQQEGTRNLFQPNAVRVQGNIRCVSDPAREAFGVFSASALVRKAITFTRSDLPERLGKPDTITMDCRYAFENSVNVRPPFW